MTDYVVNVFDYENQTPGNYRFTLNLKVKHFRQYDGRKPNVNGGHTAIFDVGSGLVFSTKCREDEQFSRRKGVLTALQKMLQSKAFQCTTSKDNYWIADVSYGSNGMNVFIDRAENIEAGTFWWLKK